MGCLLRDKFSLVSNYFGLHTAKIQKRIAPRLVLKINLHVLAHVKLTQKTSLCKIKTTHVVNNHVTPYFGHCVGWCCYITVDFATVAVQNGFCTYKLYLHEKTNFIQKISKTVDSDYFQLLHTYSSI
jgi:hypothetical protein